LVIDETRERGGTGNRRQIAVRDGFISRHMKSRKYTEGTGQQRMNSRGANDFGAGENVSTSGSVAAGL
jgi:hypothetical protein